MCVNSLTKTVTRQRRDCDLGLVEITFSGFSCAKTVISFHSQTILEESFILLHLVF